ncbi:cytochrome c biogenesis protein CcsA [Blastococcus saxobsidens]|uniref:Heme exporter protein C n=1 Tax=Blastococcus saxobsidens (strain DD2) TaxID=1146883 RepID=H6RNK9_BLASD|nr:cytochrome c biogenesis protein CcsA [Blastococcus saxobsidens]CCG03956.1 Cytochrome c assembly protein [Blastococcus saxobsidens DD2]
MASPSAGTADRIHGAAAVVVAAVAVILALVVAPTDTVQGEPQRLMYVHVPAAWLAYLSFAAVLGASVAYLLTRDLRWDRRAQAAAELGVGMTALAIALGSIWGRPVWGVWWVWDPRLVTTAVLLLVYLGYLGVRGLGDDRAAGARRAAAVGIVGFVNVPVVHFSVVWWRTLHQPATVLSPDPAPMDPWMAAALGAAVAAFTLAGVLVVRRRLRVLASADAPAAPGPAGAPPQGAAALGPTEALVVVPRTRR